MRIGQTSFVVFLSKFVGSAIGFVATIYFARELGAEVLGYYASVMALVMWLRVGGESGVASAMKKRISEGTDPSAFFTAGVAIMVGLGTVISAFVLLFGEYVDSYVGASVVGFVVLLVLVDLLRSAMMAALDGERLVHVRGVLSPIKIGSDSLVQVALVATGMGLTGLLIGYSVGGVLVTIIGLMVLSLGFERPTREHVRSLLDFAKYSWLGRLRTRTFNEVDVLMLTALVSSSLVGVYSVAWSITQFLTLFGSAVNSTLFPEMSLADSEDDTETISVLVTDALAYGGLFIIPGLFGGGLLADRLLRIYGPEFVQGTTVLWVLILGGLLYGYQTQLLNALNAVNRPDIAFRINVAFIGVNVVLNAILIVSFGFVGAAVATAISAGVGLCLAYVALRSLLSFSVPVGEVGRQIVAATVMAAIVYGSRGINSAYDLVDHNVFIVTTLVVLGAGTYFLALLGLSARFRSTVAANSPIPLPLLSK